MARFFGSGWAKALWDHLTGSRDQGALVVYVASVVVGVAGIFVYVGAWQSWKEFAAASLVGGVALAFGSLFGFLFALPRTTPESDANALAQGKIWPNSNLEQISDWLVKILVGVGLTQITTLPGQISHLVQYLAPFVGSGSGVTGFVLVLLAYFSISGFQGAYIWTRVFLPRVLVAAQP